MNSTKSKVIWNPCLTVINQLHEALLLYVWGYFGDRRVLLFISTHDSHFWLCNLVNWIVAENPLNTILSSDLNSTNILLLELDRIFFSQLLPSDGQDLGPTSGPVNLDINVKCPRRSSSYIKMKSPSKSELNYYRD